jgi:hypothetical protein
MATVTARRSLLSRILRALLRRKDPIVRPPRPGGGEGNAGVREPRRPSPVPPALSAEREL